MKVKVKAREEHGKQLVESNEVTKIDFTINRDGISLRKKNICNKLLVERASEFVGIKDKNNPNKLFYEFKTDGKIPKDLRDYRMPLELFENLRDGDLNPKEVLKNQVKFKLKLNETKIEVINQKTKKYNKKCYCAF